MENQLINLNLANLATEAQEKADRLNSLAVSTTNITSLETARTEANKEIKAVKTQIEEAKKAYLKPFAEIEAKYLEALKPYEDATKAFSSAILEAKKTKRQEELREVYDSIAITHLDEDGALPDWVPSFETATEGITQTTTKQVARDLISNRIANGKKTEVAVVLKGSRANIEKVKSFAIGLGIEWGEF